MRSTVNACGAIRYHHEQHIVPKYISIWENQLGLNTLPKLICASGRKRYVLVALLLPNLNSISQHDTTAVFDDLDGYMHEHTLFYANSPQFLHADRTHVD
jgi:hypothetical protein